MNSNDKDKMPKAQKNQKRTSTADAAMPKGVAPQVKRTQAERVADLVGWDIMTQLYKPGERMREQELSSKYEVSRTVIRDVIGKLAGRGLLEIHPWRGATIVHYSYDELRDLLDLNTTIFGIVTRLSAERATDDDLSRMEEALSDMAELAGTAKTPEEFHVARVTFYTAVNNSTGSFYTGRKRANFPLTFYHQHVLADAITKPARQEQVLFFRELLGHLKARDSKSAAECTVENFRKKRDIILTSIQPFAK